MVTLQASYAGIQYMTYMPTEEELRNEIEQQKEFFRLQHNGKNNEE